MKASVIVINLNGMQFLQDCFLALQEQTCKDFETILVDNGSTDGSVEYVQKEFSKVRVLALDKNYGFGVGNNKGMEIANGEYVALLNNDTRVAPTWLGELVKAMDNNLAIGMCASQIRFIDHPDIVDSAGDDFFRVGSAFSRRFFPVTHPDVMSPRKCLFACAGACLYRKNMLNKIGGFDKIYSPAYYEDADLGFRANIHGFECLYVPTAIVYHKVSSTMRNASRLYLYLQHRNLEIFLLKNYPWDVYFAYLPFRIILNAFLFLKYIFQGKVNTFLKAKGEFIKLIPLILKLRKKAREYKMVSEKQLSGLLLPGWFRYKVRIFGKKVV